MDITWHGHSCFTIKGESVTIVTDAYEGLGSKLPKLSAKILTFGDALAGKEGTKLEIEGAKVLDWPGEFEVSGVGIEGFNAADNAKEGGAEGEDVNIFVFSVDGIKICHLSGLAHELSDDLLNHVGDIDILLLPVGGTVVLDGKRAKGVLESIEPRIVIPMYYSATESKLEIGGAEEFLKLVSKTELEAVKKFSVKDRSDLPDGLMEFVKLEPQN
ncbi:MAG: L-ascorbate metabolism protein UlaG (beta-lactamase superfamily) [Oceanicoccus sp.]|jgi:L-ascorbate metabolism protein UlaG (beta-lactamase superfamily)